MFCRGISHHPSLLLFSCFHPEHEPPKHRPSLLLPHPCPPPRLRSRETTTNQKGNGEKLTPRNEARERRVFVRGLRGRRRGGIGGGGGRGGTNAKKERTKDRNSISIHDLPRVPRTKVPLHSSVVTEKTSFGVCVLEKASRLTFGGPPWETGAKSRCFSAVKPPLSYSFSSGSRGEPDLPLPLSSPSPGHF